MSINNLIKTAKKIEKKYFMLSLAGDVIPFPLRERNEGAPRNLEEESEPGEVIPLFHKFDESDEQNSNPSVNELREMIKEILPILPNLFIDDDEGSGELIICTGLTRIRDEGSKLGDDEPLIDFEDAK